ncbi:MAG: hypothetical protein HY265_07690 [Deltaproteobacteria bacterium]|nr:hypothetical protein [Deltaproteobacteria bacterium]
MVISDMRADRIMVSFIHMEIFTGWRMLIPLVVFDAFPLKKESSSFEMYGGAIITHDERGY